MNLFYKVVCLTLLTLPVMAQDPHDFAIQVIDAATGRGVPLVELSTTNQLKFLTDSNGIATISEPDLEGQRVFFTITSHGYEYPADGFGFHGKTLQVTPGVVEILTINRVNLAERLYRVTGGGIYRDTVLAGKTPPVAKRMVDAGVVGCDSVMAEIYGGKVYWFWGDTSRLHYPIGGNFHISGATTPLPGPGGPDPAVGFNFDYFTGDDGAVRPMAEMPGDGPTWISALTVLKDANGRERMVAGYVKIRNMLEAYRWGYVMWDDATERFDLVKEFDKKPAIFLGPQTHTFLHTDNDVEYVYLCNPFPFTRVEATLEAFFDPARYEGLSCLQAGTLPNEKRLDRDAAGRLQYSWKRGTPALDQQEQAELLEPEERQAVLRDPDTGREFTAHYGSVYWNAYRGRWILIATELGGETSLLGDIWFAEADTPTGPWRYARKILSHDNYTFYNPKHHPFFDQDGGRTIYFEGTYTHTFSGNPVVTPRYDYNQIMYRLDLSQPALNLPVPFYRVPDSAEGAPFASRRSGGVVAFYALEAPGESTVPVVWTGTALETGVEGEPLFHALPADAESAPEATAPMHEILDTTADIPPCRVWR